MSCLANTCLHWNKSDCLDLLKSFPQLNKLTKKDILEDGKAVS